ncbi:cytochrome P450 2B6-like [Babylonia areolata]|uniref:cytochrome P450 2B6-like n=1 Tax=Babylonia areolata TaxID=304850 RepID=UPI003FD5DF81
MLDVVLIFLTILLAWWWLVLSRRPSDLPPGPTGGLPFLGHLPLLRRDPRPQFQTWRQEYGDVFGFYMAGRLVVVLNGYETIREALVKRADAFSVRPSMFVTEFITRSGIAFNSGPSWKEQRKISLEILRSLGMGKPQFTINILQEVGEFVKAVRDLQGQPTNLAKIAGVSMSNNICGVVFGRRFEYDNVSFLRYLELMRENLQLLRSTNLLNYLPWLRFLPGDRFGAKKILRNIAEMEQCFLIPQIQQHIDRENNKGRRHKHGGESSRESDDAEDDNNNDNDDDNHRHHHHHYHHDDDDDDNGHVDFISAYLTRVKREMAQGKLSTTVEENLNNLEWTVSDLFVAGTETLTNALLWTLLYLLHHPRVQSACYRQIRQVLGPSSPPDAHHRAELPYVEATIMETLRISDIGAMGIQHGVSQDVELRGFRVPKGTIVVPYLHTALNDKVTWGDPECFRPERFLDPENGRVVVVKREEFIPFSVGRRSCPGEGIARLQLFLYVTSLLQNFRFLPAEEGRLPSLEGVMEFAHNPNPFRIRAVPRQPDEGD